MVDGIGPLPSSTLIGLTATQDSWRDRIANGSAVSGQMFSTPLSIWQFELSRCHRRRPVPGVNARGEACRHGFLLGVAVLGNHLGSMLIEVEGGIELRLLCQ